MLEGSIFANDPKTHLMLTNPRLTQFWTGPADYPV